MTGELYAYCVDSNCYFVPYCTPAISLDRRRNLLPGFVRVFASGSVDNSFRLETLPAPVAQQLRNLEAFSINEQAALTVGPKFPGGTPTVGIVADFAAGIEILVKNHYLSAETPVIQELPSTLQQHLPLLGNASQTPAEEFVPFTLQLQHKAQAPLKGQSSKHFA